MRISDWSSDVCSSDLTGVASLDLGSSALVTDAGAIRGLELDRLEVLDLSALLDALGISLADLPLDIVVGLVDQLGLPLPAGLSPDALLASIDAPLADTGPARTQVSGLKAQIDPLQRERKSGVWGKRVVGTVDFGGRGHNKK